MNSERVHNIAVGPFSIAIPAHTSTTQKAEPTEDKATIKPATGSVPNDYSQTMSLQMKQAGLLEKIEKSEKARSVAQPESTGHQPTKKIASPTVQVHQNVMKATKPAAPLSLLQRAVAWVKTLLGIGQNEVGTTRNAPIPAPLPKPTAGAEQTRRHAGPLQPKPTGAVSYDDFRRLLGDAPRRDTILKYFAFERATETLHQLDACEAFLATPDPLRFKNVLATMSRFDLPDDEDFHSAGMQKKLAEDIAPGEFLENVNVSRSTKKDFAALAESFDVEKAKAAVASARHQIWTMAAGTMSRWAKTD